MLRPFQTMFRTHAIERSYLAVVEGIVKPARGTIDLPLVADRGDGRHRRRQLLGHRRHQFLVEAQLVGAGRQGGPGLAHAVGEPPGHARQTQVGGLVEQLQGRQPGGDAQRVARQRAGLVDVSDRRQHAHQRGRSGARSGAAWIAALPAAFSGTLPASLDVALPK